MTRIRRARKADPSAVAAIQNSIDMIGYALDNGQDEGSVEFSLDAFEMDMEEFLDQIDPTLAEQIQTAWNSATKAKRTMLTNTEKLLKLLNKANQ
jgi:hypothetical protein